MFTSGKNSYSQDIVLWLDGMDPLGTGTPPSSGSSLPTWADKSGIGNNAIAFNTIPWTSNSPYVVGTTLTSNTTNPQLYRMPNLPVTMNNQSVFFVGNCTNGSGTADFIATQSITTGSNVGFLQNRIIANRVQISKWGGGSVVNPFGTITSGNTFLYSMTYQYPPATSPGVFAFLNGGSSSGTGTSFSQSGVGNVQIGGYTNNAANQGGEYWSGMISEVIIYSTALSTVNRQKVEGYLAWKWNISLPISHPYYSAPPSGFLPTQL